MRWKNQILTAAGLALATSSLLAVPVEQLKENYQSIIERNPFGLQPPKQPTVATNLPEVKPKVEIFLTGITAVGHPRLPRQAYFYTREQGKKDLTYYALSEGAGRDGIQVLDIDPDKRKVKVKMDNAETLLSFETHGVPITAVAAGRPLPGVPGQVPAMQMPGQPGAQPLPMPGSAPVNYDANGQPVYNPPQNTIAPGNSINPNQGSTGLRQIPSRRIRGGSTYNSGAAPVPMGPGGIGEGGQPMGQGGEQPYVDPAEKYVRSHLNAEAQRQRSSVPMPPLPTIE